MVIEDLDVMTREQLLQRREGATQAPRADQQVRAAQRAPLSLGQRKNKQPPAGGGGSTDGRNEGI